jgi:iron(III) transport system ATP-binding protein
MLSVKNIAFKYKKDIIINDVSFIANQGDHISIIGESGSGKSTLLKLIYGEFDLIKGEIFWKRTSILGPKHNLIVGYDFMKYVTQEFDLMPFISVEDNIGKFLSRFYPEDKQKRVTELLKIVELEDYAKTQVHYLSGGQKQRVALARALAKQPEIILLDEPFSHIDNFKKQSLRRSVFKYLKEHNITCIVATHDKEDALPFSNKVIVLHQGEIIANETPHGLYNNPKSPLIASFFEEYSLFKNSELEINKTNKNTIVYSNQLKKTKSSQIKAVVTDSYFKGSYYLIEATFNNKMIFFNHTEALKNKSVVFLEYIK